MTETPPVRKPSVVDFNHAEFIEKTAGTLCPDMSVEDLLKYIIARSVVEKNPVVSTSCERILKQINREPTPFNRGRFNNRKKPHNKQVKPEEPIK
jgi:hypothetical protein